MRISKILLLAGLLAACLRLSAQPGTLDPVFGRAGRVATNVYRSDDQAFGAVRRPDGRLLVVGSAQLDSVNAFCALQLLPNGTPDPSFDLDGQMILSLGSGEEIAYAAALYPDGRAILAGIESYGFGKNDFALLRITADGKPDPAFGNNGKVLTDFNGGNEFVDAVLLQPDGKIIVAGSTAQPGAEADLAMARYLPNGSLDSSFGVNGKVVRSLSVDSDVTFDAVLLPDGKILLAGELYYDVTSSDFLVARFLPNGNLDFTFGNNGFSTVDFNAPYDLCRGIALQPDGHIVLAGLSSFDDFISRITVCRLDAGGHLDPTFGVNGRVVQEIGLFSSFGTDVQVQPDSKILVSGMTEDIDQRDFFVLRLQANGLTDSTFGTAGVVTTSVSALDDNSYALVLDPDGSMSLAGKSQGPKEMDVVVLRYAPNGALDPGFGSQGIVRMDLGNSYDAANGMLVEPNGNVLLCGFAFNDPSFGGNVDAVLAEYLPDGNLNPLFGAEGIATAAFTPVWDYWTALTRQSDEKILTAGIINKKPGIARYLPSGQLDNDFAGQGKMIVPEGEGSNFRTIVTQTDGKFVVAGDPGPEVFRNLFLRFDADGTPDSTFGTNGVAADIFPQGIQMWSKVEVLPDGKLLGIGLWISFDTAALGGYYAARYLENGTPDPGFGQQGVLLFNPQHGLPFVDILGFTRQPNGKILLCGNSGDDFAVFRLSENGLPDPEFGTGGLRVYDYGQAYNEFLDIQIQADGRIIAGGRTTNFSGPFSGDQLQVLRLEPDGALDQTFADGGIFHYPGVYASAVRSLPDRHILVMGAIYEGSNRNDILLLQLLGGPALGIIDGPGASPTLLAFPNPVAESLQLEYELTQDQRVTIQLFDALGKQAGLLLDGERRDTGPQKEQLFFPKNLPSGIYTLALKTGSGTRKAVQILKK